LEEKIVANPGSTLGEAIGTLVELEVNRLLKSIADENDCEYITAGPINVRTNKPTKLLLRDFLGNRYQIDSVIANRERQPLVIIESKYIRYTKHNRDKGSWVCTAHYNLRRTFPTIRKSVAVIVGNWSAPSKALMRSFDINLFEVSFTRIVETLAEYNIDILWKEKEREKVELAQKKWSGLSITERLEIARRLLSEIELPLRESMRETLDTTVLRKVNEVEVTIKTNLGESRRYAFEAIKDLTEFLEGFNEQEVLNDKNGPRLWTPASLPSAKSIEIPTLWQEIPLNEDLEDEDLESEDLAGEDA
jgi:hypothetical protein